MFVQMKRNNLFKCSLICPSYCIFSWSISLKYLLLTCNVTSQKCLCFRIWWREVRVWSWKSVSFHLRFGFNSLRRTSSVSSSSSSSDDDDGNARRSSLTISLKQIISIKFKFHDSFTGLTSSQKILTFIGRGSKCFLWIFSVYIVQTDKSCFREEIFSFILLLLHKES